MLSTNSAATLNAINQKALEDPRVAEMQSRRPAKKYRVFEIGNGIFFEYWNKNEWEFTLTNLSVDFVQWNRAAMRLMTEIRLLDPTTDKLPRIVKLAKKHFADFL